MWPLRRRHRELCNAIAPRVRQRDPRIFQMSKVKGARERAQVLPIDLDLVAFDISFYSPHIWMNPMRRARLYTATPKAVDQALARLVPVRSTPYGAYTPGLSTE